MTRHQHHDAHADFLAIRAHGEALASYQSEIARWHVRVIAYVAVACAMIALATVAIGHRAVADDRPAACAGYVGAEVTACVGEDTQ